MKWRYQVVHEGICETDTDDPREAEMLALEKADHGLVAATAVSVELLPIPKGEGDE